MAYGEVRQFGIDNYRRSIELRMDGSEVSEIVDPLPMERRLT